LPERGPDAALAKLGPAVFRNPETTQWETADAYLSGPVRTRLAVAEAAAALDPQYERNVIALRAVQPKDISPSDITARLGAPWIPTDVIEAFVRDVMGTGVRVWHTVELATWTVQASAFSRTAARTCAWGTSRRPAGPLRPQAVDAA